MSTTKTVSLATSTGTGRQAVENTDVAFPDGGTNRSYGVIGVLSESVVVTDFTDGGSTSGTLQLTGSVPAGAVLLGSKVIVTAGFAGDTTATLTIGDGSDVDRYNTGTPSVFATAATGIETGVPSGNKLVTTANRPTLTVTSSADFTSVKSNGSGALTVNIYFLQTA